MSALSITRTPIPHDPALGAEALNALPALSSDMAELIRGAAGSSPYLKGLMAREAGWLETALADPDAALADVTEAARQVPPEQIKPGLREAKRRVALLTALADLSGAWPLEKVTGALTDFAALACDIAARAEIAALIRRRKLPGLGEDDLETAGGLVILAMGKMGAHELNYSSDIDLICLFDERRFDPDDFYEARQGMVRATRQMCATLSDLTGDGYVFRTDLRLRPDPAVTPVCLAIEAAERYYESLGRTWERAAYIKARAAAGDLAAGERFLKGITPFVWRRHLDFAAIQDAHDMRLRIRESKGSPVTITIPGHDLKLGRGGIREIEFFTQTRQLIAGGRDQGLRLRGTVPGLAALAASGWIPQAVTDKLGDHYRALRDYEHRAQMIHDAQTHHVPKNPEDRARMANLAGMTPEAMETDLQARLAEVHELTEDFFAPDSAPMPKAQPPAVDAGILARWPTYPALRSQRARQVFERLKPDLLARLTRAPRPDEALRALDGFLAGLPAGVQLFSLLEANPQLIDLLVDIAGTSPALAGYLSRNAGVFDAVIGGDFFAAWPGQDDLNAALAATLSREADYEARLDATRRWFKEWHFRIGVHHLRGLITGAEAGREYAALAEAVVVGLLPIVTEEFARKHGPPPGRGAAVLGMGSLGAGQLNALSDLDLIVIYDADGAESSDGRRPLATRLYYARLTQALITALTAPMAEGRLYEVDMRLRPSGHQGPVATSWQAFRDYQGNEAWTWEHLAQTRARVIAAHDSALGAEIAAFRADLLARPRDRQATLADVSDMRARIAAAKPPGGMLDPKTGPGRLMDIELTAQTGALLAGSVGRSVGDGLDAGAASGWLAAEDADALRRAYALLWEVQSARRLISGQGIETAAIGEGGAVLLTRNTEHTTAEALESALEAVYADSARRIDAAMQQTGERR